MGRRKRQPSPRAKQAQQGLHQASAAPPGQPQADSPASQLLERIRHARVAQQNAEAELAMLVDRARF